MRPHSGPGALIAWLVVLTAKVRELQPLEVIDDVLALGMTDMMDMIDYEVEE
jgi:hypothetical protein